MNRGPLPSGMRALVSPCGAGVGTSNARIAIPAIGVPNLGHGVDGLTVWHILV